MKTKGMSDRMERREDSNKWHLAIAKREALIQIGDNIGVKWPTTPRNMRMADIEKIVRESTGGRRE
jgi:hypothetical protein